MSTHYYIRLLQKACPVITEYFDTSVQRVFKQGDLSRLLAKHHIDWNLYPDVPTRAFINYLCKQSDMVKVELVFGESKSRKDTRYIWGDASIFELALSLKNRSYFSHHTAAYLLGLTAHFPRTVYLNFEQSKRLPSGELTQEAIDIAFQNSVRISHNVAQYGHRKICLVNGMYTNQLGVIEMVGERGENLRLAGIERTLVDIAVRPVYSGGIMEVLKIYRNSSKKFSVRHLVEIFKKMGYVYPYHQVIGFYLDRAGVYTEKDIDLLHKIDMRFNFYLTHKMGETSFSEKWRLFYPKELDTVTGD